MPCLIIQLGVKQRKRIGNFLSLLSLVQVIAACATCLCELYFEYNIKWAVDAIGGFNSHFLQNIILTSGVASFFVYIIGTKIYFDTGHEKTRSHFITSFSLWSIVLWMLAMIKIVAICYSYWCMSSFKDPFRKGFLKTIKNYLNDTDVRENVDYLQSEYKCCGADSFKDWMETSWIPDEYNVLVDSPEDIKLYTEFYKDPSAADIHKPPITPYSCCDTDISGPCIHDFLVQKDLAETIKETWWLGPTLWQKGCGEIFEKIYNRFLVFVFQFTFASLCLDLFMMVPFRYLRRSVEMLELSPNEEGISPGWLCDCFPAKIIEGGSESTGKLTSKKNKHRIKI